MAEETSRKSGLSREVVAQGRVTKNKAMHSHVHFQGQKRSNIIKFIFCTKLEKKSPKQIISIQDKKALSLPDKKKIECIVLYKMKM